MKVVILAGGMQSTISNEQEGIPKPMAEIGEKPILWHIMKTFSAYGFRDFIICGGYKVNFIKDYFNDFYIYQSDITVDLLENTIEIHKKKTENWIVTVVDTGVNSTPSQRIIEVKDKIGEEDFIVVHGDCLSDIDIMAFVEKHKSSDAIATVAVAKPTGRNKILAISEDNKIQNSIEFGKEENHAWVNACYQVFSKGIFLYLEKSTDIGELLFEQLARDHQLMVFQHEGFWSPIETKRDIVQLERLWMAKKAPWKKW